MESENDDLNPRSAPARSPSIPSSFAPSVPEVSLMFNNAHWLTSQTISPVDHAAINARYQEYFTNSRNEVSADSINSSNLQRFNSSGTASNTYISPGHRHKMTELNRNCGERSEKKASSQYNNRMFESLEESQIHSMGNIYQNKKLQFETNKHACEETLIKKQQCKQSSPGPAQHPASKNRRELKSNEQYIGWRTYFDSKASTPECSNEASRMEDIPKFSTRIEMQSKHNFGNATKSPISQKAHFTAEVREELHTSVSPMLCSLNSSDGVSNSSPQHRNMSSSSRSQIPISGITETQLQNIILKVIADMRNSSVAEDTKQAHVAVDNKSVQLSPSDDLQASIVKTTRKSVQNVEDNLHKNVEKEMVLTEKQNSQTHYDSQMVRERSLQKSLSDTGTQPTNGRKRPGDTHCPEKIGTEDSCIQNSEEAVANLYELYHSQADQLKIIQEKIDKIILLQEINLRNTLSCPPSLREQTVLSSERKPHMVDIATQTDATFHREIAIGTEPQETGTVGIIAGNTDLSEGCLRNGAFPDKRGQFQNGTYMRPSSHETISEEAHPDESLCLNSLNLPSVQIHVPSPMPSIHVDMQDFEEDDDEDLNSESSHSSSGVLQNGQTARVGWTFYNKVVGQVNKLLDNQTDNARNYDDTDNAFNEVNTIDRRDVRTATLEQLKKMGISFHSEDQDVPTHKRAQQFDSMHYPRLEMRPFDGENSECDNSLQINALAMKYMKEDNFKEAKLCNISMKTNFSFATLRYLERYHLLPSNNQEGTQGVPGNHIGGQFEARKSPNAHCNGNVDKILDITTIKNQPKLL